MEQVSLVLEMQGNSCPRSQAWEPARAFSTYSLNTSLGLWGSCQRLGVRWWFSLVTMVSSATYIRLVTIWPRYWKNTLIEILSSNLFHFGDFITQFLFCWRMTLTSYNGKKAIRTVGILQLGPFLLLIAGCSWWVHLIRTGLNIAVDDHVVGNLSIDSFRTN